MNTSDPQFWMMIASIVIAVCFVVMAIALIVIAFLVKKAVNTVSRVEERIEPMFSKVNAIGEQGKEIAVQFNQLSGHLSVATKHFSESAGLIKEEVAELKQLVGMTAHEAKDKVALVSKTIDRTQMQVTTTADFIQEKIVEPAVEVAAVMAGVKRGLQVLFAPTPKRIDRVFTDDEMFIG
ncbi:MAG TPA: hypothetical protein VK892_08345 [Pyrinomonadaceae bacterium]|nr:hypothetical protein [Pyrinomonadaceae bacterium]